MTKEWHEEHEWAKNKKRKIDDKTIIDLLKMIEYQSERTITLSDIGFNDIGGIEDVLFDYVLDALEVPPEKNKLKLKGEHEKFIKTCSFKREWFYELFYSEFLIENKTNKYSYEDVINIIRKEVKENLKKHYK